MKLIIEDDEGRKTVVPMVREEITIGRQDGNTIRLTERNVSRRHARLFKDNGNLVIEDLGSYNGVRVNGEKVSSPTAIKEGDLVEIGDYDLGVQGKLEMATPSPKPPPAVMKPPQTTPISVKPTAPPPAPPPAPEVAPAAQPPIVTPTAGGATAIIRVSDIMKSASQVEVRDLQRTEMPRLVGLAGPFRAKEFYLMRSEVKFGRTDENDIVMDHQSVSRSHAKFVLEDGQWKIYDNKSANGVRVNGDEYAVSNVNPGDTLELGHLKFRFCAPGEKFSAPPEKGAEEKQTGGMKPTTAELIAGAQGRGPTPSFQAPPQQKKSPLGLIIGIVAALAIVAGGAFFLLGKNGKSKSDSGPEGEDAVKAGDVQFKQHHYLEAQKLYEQAGDTPAPNKKKITDEAHGEEEYQAIKSAVDGGDGDKAKALFEKCATESNYWCQKAQTDLADPVKSAYSKKHIAAANAAKTAGKNDVCRNEANLVLAFDSGNNEAQGLVTGCAPPVEAAKPPPPAKVAVAPAPENKETKAAKLAKSCSDKLIKRDFQGAVNDGQAALALAPTSEDTQAQMYRCLGYGSAYLNDTDSAKKYLKLFKPFCGKFAEGVCTQVDQFLAR